MSNPNFGIVLTYPDSRALLSIQDLELDTSFVYYSTCNAIQRVNFSEHCALSYTAKTRIA